MAVYNCNYKKFYSLLDFSSLKIYILLYSNLFNIGDPKGCKDNGNTFS